MDRALLVINAGSSSIKFKLYRDLRDDIDLVLGGALDGIGTRPHLKAKDRAGTTLIDRAFATADVSTSAQAQAAVADWLAPRIASFDIAGIGHRVAHDALDQAPLLEDILLRRLSVNPLQHIVVLWPKKGERRDQRTGADAGNDLEIRACPGCGPAVEKAGTIGAIVASTGDCEERDGREGSAMALPREPGLLLLKVGLRFGCEGGRFSGHQIADRLR